MPMPPPDSLSQDSGDHLDQARHNYRLYLHLQAEGQFLDWAITLLFYTALHLVQAHAAQFGPWVPENHEERRAYIREQLNRLFYDYRDLEDRSRDMRYDLYPTTAEEVQSWHDLQFGRIVGFLARRGIRLQPSE